MGTSSVTFIILIKTPSIPCYTCTHKLFIVVSAYRYIGKDQKYDCRCPPVQSTEEKGCQEHQITSKAQENSNAFSSPSISDSSRVIPFFSRSLDTADTISSSATRRTPAKRTSARRTSAKRNIGWCTRADHRSSKLNHSIGSFLDSNKYCTPSR